MPFDSTVSPPTVERERRLMPPACVAEEMSLFRVSRNRTRRIRGKALDLVYRAEGWECVDCCADEAEAPPVRRRVIRGCLLSRRRKVGYIEFQEYEITQTISDRQFLDICEADSVEDAEIARTVLGAWPVNTVARHGRIAILRLVWVSRDHARHGEWVEPVRTFIGRRWDRAGRTQAGVLLLRPFPLEYDVDGEQAATRNVAIMNARIAGLQRLYRRTLGLQPLPDSPWMWRTFANRLRQPATPRRGGWKKS